MGRDPRVLIRGATYHVMNRGNRKERIFEDDRDRRRFLRIFVAEKERYGVDFLGGCPIGNHFHAIVTTPHGNLSDFMEQLDGQFAKYSNWRYGRVGHLFQGRFRGVLIEHDIQLLTALCYVFFNPTRWRKSHASCASVREESARSIAKSATHDGTDSNEWCLALAASLSIGAWHQPIVY